MGVVIPFIRPSSTRAELASAGTCPVSAVEGAVLSAARDRGDQRAVLNAAAPLLERIRDRYGFAVMRDGLPDDPDELATALAGLLRAFSRLDADIGSGRALSTFGVYFGREKLTWFDDGYGRSTALAVPLRFDPSELAEFVRPRIGEARL